MENKRYTLKVFETANELFESGCELIFELSQKAILEKGKFTVALSGGNTPQQLYMHLTKPEFCNKIDWQNFFIFWGDERCVPMGDDRNNAHLAKSLLLDKLKIPVSHIYPIPVDVSPAEAARNYEKTIKDFFSGQSPTFDLILLGLGVNGHTASIFPMTNVIHEQDRYVKEVYVEEQRLFRVTMTAPLINQAHHILFLVTGENKSKVLEKVLTAPYQPDQYPAQLIKPLHGTLSWFVDHAAAVNISY